MAGAKKIAAWFAAIAISIITAFAGIAPASAISASKEGITVSAATTSNAFDSTSVNDDLAGMNMTVFAPNAAGEPSLVKFVEYCFSNSALKCTHYALYLYVYNPAKMEVSKLTGSNTLMLATSYDEAGKPSEYEKLPLKLCGVSTGTIEGLVYKYRVQDENNKILQNVLTQNAAEGERRYDLSEIELWQVGQSNPKSYGISKTYRYSGYAAGYGDSEESTLSATVEELEQVITFRDGEIKDTYYHYPSTTTTSTQINSVYFAVDNDLIETYGYITRILAEYWDYLTAPMIVTENNEFYEYMQNWLGIDIGEYNAACEAKFFAYYDGTYIGDAVAYQTGYNGYYHYPTGADGQITKLSQLYYRSDVDNYTLTAEEMKSYWQDYTADHGSGSVYGGYNDDLFVGGDGYKLIDVGSSDLFTINGFDMGNAFDTWWEQLLSGFSFDETDKTIEPIYFVKPADVKAESYICDRLYVAERDVAEFLDFYDEATEQDKTVVMFRFAVSEYAARDITVNVNGKSYSGESELRQEHVYLGFDMIQLTFTDEAGVDTIFAVAASPIDVIADAPHSNEPTFPDFAALWENIKATISIILGIVVVVFILSIVVKIVGAIQNANNTRKINKLYKDNKKKKD